MAIVTDEIGDIFSAPAHSVLIHACNAKGSWSSGVALAFKHKYPAAFKIYATYCKNPPESTSLTTHQTSLVGKTLLIPPQEFSPEHPRHWIACLFTSLNYGRNVDSTAQILHNTELAIADLERQVKELRSKPANARDSSADADAAGDTIFVAPGSFYAVRINSGKFGVPWARTKAVLQRGMFDLYVVRPPGEDEVGNKPEQIPAAVKRKRKLEEREVDTRKLKKRREGRKIARNKREI